MRRRDRAKMAALKPVLHQGGAKRCKLHVELTYLAFSDAEQQLIARGSSQGMEQMLDSPEVRRLSLLFRQRALA